MVLFNYFLIFFDVLDWYRFIVRDDFIALVLSIFFKSVFTFRFNFLKLFLSDTFILYDEVCRFGDLDNCIGFFILNVVLVGSKFLLSKLKNNTII
jgi:hypothetical protein